MDKFKVILLPNAQKFYGDCSLEEAKRFNKCFEDLEENPFWGPNIKLLKTKKKTRLYRYKVSNYRVVYEIDKENRKVGILYISPRSSSYRNI